MPAFENLLAFFSIAVLLALTPGPDNIFVLVQSAQRGWRAGLAVVAGLCSGIAVHSIAVALGLAAVLAASANAFTILKWAGALYLLWMAWSAWNAPVGSKTIQAGTKHAANMRITRTEAVHMWGRGFIMNLSNPKVLIFFLAFLPQFADPQADWPVAAQILIFGALFMLATALVFGAIACFSGMFGHLLQRSAQSQKVLNRLASAVFIGLAARMATLQR